MFLCICNKAIHDDWLWRREVGLALEWEPARLANFRAFNTMGDYAAGVPLRPFPGVIVATSCRSSRRAPQIHRSVIEVLHRDIQ